MRKDRAMEFRRAAQMAAQGASDTEALAMPSVYQTWGEVLEAGRAVPKGRIVLHGGRLYRCLTAHTPQADWAPGVAPSLWVGISDPTQEWPPWVQPQGAHDAYAKGAQVTHSGRRWTSDADNNVWEPGVHGWKEAI